MSGLFPILLFAHVMGSIVAIGPTFAFPLVGSMAGREPAHGNFATRVTSLIDDRIVLPFVTLTGATGVAMIWVRGLPVLEPAFRWLVLSIVLYVVAFAFALAVQRPTVRRLIELSAASGQPGPELGATAGRVARNGIVLAVLAIAEVFLMVVKPSLGG
jgi:uncharacterized membrane protein